MADIRGGEILFTDFGDEERAKKIPTREGKSQICCLPRKEEAFLKLLQ